jgi:hypothetical protein
LKRVFFLVALAASAAFAKMAPAQYPLTVAVEESRVVNRCDAALHGDSTCHDYREVRALIDGIITSWRAASTTAF